MGSVCSSSKIRKTAVKNDNSSKEKNEESKKEEVKEEAHNLSTSNINNNENNENKVEKKVKIIDDHPKEDTREIKIIYLEKGVEKFSHVFKRNQEVHEIFSALETIEKYSEYDILYGEENQSLKCNFKDKLSNILPDIPEVEVTILYLGLNIDQNVMEKYSSQGTMIGAPIFNLGNKIGVAIYSNYEKSFKIQLINNEKLAVFNNLSAYCNANDTLFISGGELNEELIKKNKNENIENENEEEDEKNNYLNEFYSIDLKNTNNVQKMEPLIKGRAWHSMIYVPPHYIFIVGGTTNAVELYDLEKHTITVDSYLLETRNECTLCVLNDALLIAFFGFVMDNNYSKTIEQCNLRAKKRQWSIIEYALADDTIIQDTYYISYFRQPCQIILFAVSENGNGSDEPLDNLEFDIEHDKNPTIRRFNNNFNISDIIPEKFFHPFKDNTSVLLALPSFNAKLYRLNKNLELKTIEITNDLLE